MLLPSVAGLTPESLEAFLCGTRLSHMPRAQLARVHRLTTLSSHSWQGSKVLLRVGVVERARLLGHACLSTPELQVVNLISNHSAFASGFIPAALMSTNECIFTTLIVEA
jgi:hypothetical protein